MEDQSCCDCRYFNLREPDNERVCWLRGGKYGVDLELSRNPGLACIFFEATEDRKESLKEGERKGKK